MDVDEHIFRRWWRTRLILVLGIRAVCASLYDQIYMTQISFLIEFLQFIFGHI